MKPEHMATLLKEQISHNRVLNDGIEKVSDVTAFRNEYKITVTPTTGKDFIVSAKDESERKKQTTRLRLYQCKCDPAAAKAEGRTNKIRCASDKMEIGCAVCGEMFELQNGNGKEE